MSPHFFLGLVGLMYIFTTFSYFKGHRIGMAIAFVGYTIGQIGLIIDSIEMGGKQD